MAEILSRSLSGRAVLCELFGAQGSVLEHNVSVEVVARYKRASLDRLTTMTALIRKYLPELGENVAFCSLQTMIIIGAPSAYRTPSPSLRAAYQAEPGVARSCPGDVAQAGPTGFLVVTAAEGRVAVPDWQACPLRSPPPCAPR